MYFSVSNYFRLELNQSVAETRVFLRLVHCFGVCSLSERDLCSLELLISLEIFRAKLMTD